MFSMVNKNNSAYINSLKNIPNQKPIQTMMFQSRQFPNKKQQSLSQPIVTTKSFANSDGDKIKWGQPTWRFFHVIAHKIKPEYFKQVRQELLNNIYSICTTLPCPVCAQHATQYMNAQNFNNIQTKEDLKDMLFAFHNSVNARKNYKPMDKSELDSTYANFNLIAVAREFMYYYKDRNRSMKLLADDLLRSRLSVNIQKWFNEFYIFCEP
jgi:hypothetical protein